LAVDRYFWKGCAQLKVEPLGDWTRSHRCGDLRAADIGKEVCLMGWVNKSRDHGGVIFVDLRDRYGLTQVVFDPTVNAENFVTAEKMRSEFVVAIKGVVRRRPEGMENPKLPTGEIEALVHEVHVLNTSEPLPISVSEEGPEDERVRLRYRYLDLRRPRMQKNIIFRSGINKLIRDYFDGKGFLEIDTPVLGKSTPEGARDFLVPCRLNPGTFYALPQSPQLFKQILMASNFDKYFQIVKCYRDEDLRADRQPEHTQIDLEMSFIREDDIYSLIECLIVELFDKSLGFKVETPFPRYSYDEIMMKYAVDKPDLRYDLEITELTEVIRGSDFKVFESIIAGGGVIRGIKVPGGAKSLSRKQIDDLIAYSQKLGSTGLAWMRVTENGLESNIVKYFNEEKQKALIEAFGAVPGDLLTFLAGRLDALLPVLAQLRVHIAREIKMEPKRKYAFCWVTDFPLFEWDPAEKRWAPMHHIFSMPRDEDIQYLDSDPGRVKGRLYDLVMNGVELGSGSIRIHIPELQQRVFNIIGITKEQAEIRFGFLLEAFRYGAPPHGGIALGIDRLLMLMLDENSIREVITFPKTQTGTCLMTGAPSEVDRAALREAGVQLFTPPAAKKTDENSDGQASAESGSK
jgi:aspartyl-tRNA synthetase